MTGVDAIVASFKQTQHWLGVYVNDFSDAELLDRPVPGANHTAWQIGNVIVGDIFLIQSTLPNATFPELPEGFMKLHGPKGTGIDQDPGFLSKDGYLKLFDEIRKATVANIKKLSDADLDGPVPENMQFGGKNVGELLLFTALHTFMHAGQFTVIRRKLCKPVLF